MCKMAKKIVAIGERELLQVPCCKHALSIGLWQLLLLLLNSISASLRPIAAIELWVVAFWIGGATGRRCGS